MQKSVLEPSHFVGNGFIPVEPQHFVMKGFILDEPPHVVIDDLIPTGPPTPFPQKSLFPWSLHGFQTEGR